MAVQSSIGGVVSPFGWSGDGGTVQNSILDSLRLVAQQALRALVQQSWTMIYREWQYRLIGRVVSAFGWSGDGGMSEFQSGLTAFGCTESSRQTDVRIMALAQLGLEMLSKALAMYWALLMVVVAGRGGVVAQHTPAATARVSCSPAWSGSGGAARTSRSPMASHSCPGRSRRRSARMWCGAWPASAAGCWKLSVVRVAQGSAGCGGRLGRSAAG